MQQFHELLSSKAKPKARDSICSPLREEDLAQRIEAKLNAAQQKRYCRGITFFFVSSTFMFELSFTI